MNCSNWEERIALYAGGDLEPAQAEEVERHLGDCVGCQVFASGLKQSLELFQTAHREPIAAAHFAVVRARVMAKLEGARTSWWQKAWVYGLGAAVAALLVMLALRPGAPVPQRRVAVLTPRPVMVPAPAAGVTRVTRVRSRIKRRSVRSARADAGVRATSGPPVVVKLLTDDPDVVIYWITDKSGE